MNSSNKPSLLICADWFDPGIRAGGPIRSCVNLTRLLGQQYRTTIITSNRDLGASSSYPDIAPNQWTVWKQRAAVIYCSGMLRRMLAFTTLLRKRPQSTVYLNSMFSVAGTLWPLLWIWMTQSSAQVVLAPRGMLKPSAFSIKRWKKFPLITLMRLSGICRRVRFHATSYDEVAEIRRMFGNVEIMNVPNIPSQPLTSLPDHEKKIGTATLCTVGRIHPIKNPLWLLKALKTIAGNVHLVIAGPVEDEAYCQQATTRRQNYQTP